MKTNLRWANFLRCHFVASASGDCQTAKFLIVSLKPQMTLLNSQRPSVTKLQLVQRLDCLGLAARHAAPERPAKSSHTRCRGFSRRERTYLSEADGNAVPGTAMLSASADAG